MVRRFAVTVTSITFLLVDVFSDRPLGGNQLAVVPDARGLDDAVMQAIAREFNYSETTFVLPPRASRASRRLRCFSPSSEVFGAGHNALGAWWALAARADISVGEGQSRFWQQLGERVLPVDIFTESGRLTRVAMTQSTPQVFKGAPARDEIAAALGLDCDALDVPGLELQVVSTGAAHLLVPARGLVDLARVRVNANQLTELAKPFGCEGCYLFCLETREPGATAHARAFFPGIGIVEDPATGSAAGPLGWYLAEKGRAARGRWVIIEQGDEIHRPSRIDVRVTEDVVEVAGRCVVVGEGRLLV